MVDDHRALRLAASDSVLLVVDVQERLLRAMPEPRLADLRRSARILTGAARELGVPALYTEQYPKGLGPTDAELLSELQAASAQRFEKLDFSACGQELLRTLEQLGRRSVVMIGMETHVCVYLTARALSERGYHAHIAADGVVSRRDDHREIGLDLCARAGAVVSTSETIVFDWMERAGSDTFKKISALVR